MGRSAQENFYRRFGNPPRITVKFSNIEDEPDPGYHYDKIFSAWVGCVRALLGREPTEAEIFGEVSLEETINSMKQSGIYSGCLNKISEAPRAGSNQSIRPDRINVVRRSYEVARYGADPIPATKSTMSRRV